MGKNTIRKKVFKTKKTQKVLDDQKINVMLLGNSGTGKSTLINAYLNTRIENAPTGTGNAITDEIRVYGDKSKLDFRLIDTPGLEYSHKRQNWLLKEIKKWMKDSVKNQNPHTIIHTIWFCVSGTEKRLPKESIDCLHTIEKFWNDVPVIFVVTKTLSDNEAKENASMIRKELNKFGRDKINYKGVVHVLAQKMAASEPRGIAELQKLTEEIGPEARAIFEKNWREKCCTKKRAEAQSIVISRAVAATALDAVKSKGGVSKHVNAIQSEMFKQVAEVYEIEDDNTIKSIVNNLMGTHAIAAIGKKLAGKAVPLAKGRLKIAAKATTATISGVITLTVGEIGIVVFENIYKGDLDIDNTDWDKYVAKILKDKSFSERLKKTKKALLNKDGDSLIDELVDILGRINS